MSEHKFHITVIVLLLILALIGGYLAFGMYKIVNALPKSLTSEEILGKLYAHSDLSQYRDTKPDALVQITSQNIEGLAQQIPGLDQSSIGAFVVGFADRIVIYDYNTDRILANIPISRQPQQTESASPTTAPKPSATATQQTK